MEIAEKKQRLLSLDVLRGLTVGGMILVNNGGPTSYAPLRHAAWNGLTIADLVFPFFLFMVGISTYISLQKFEFKSSASIIGKIMKRTLIILLLGWGLYWFESCLKGDFLPFEHLRIPGVLQRIALCYGIASLLAISVNHKWFPWLIGGLLVGYAIVLLVGNGYVCDATNILSVIDKGLLGEAHVYHKSPVDPEGLLGILPSIAHTLIGFWCGKLLMQFFGFILMAAGLAISYGLPFNKRIWSPSFVLFTCGLCTSLLAFLIYVIDFKGKKQWTSFLTVFGVNPLFIYILSEILAAVFNEYRISDVAYEMIASAIPDPYFSSLMYAVCFVLLNWLVGYPLYKKKVYIKI
jgi:predicted acyltransferase